MLQGEKPFGSWRESELDTFAKIAKGQLNIPDTFSPEAVDLLTKVSLAYLVISFSFAFYLSLNCTWWKYKDFSLACSYSNEWFAQLLEVDENTRLGSQGPDSVKCHPWFDGVDWERVADCSFPVPHEITSRITLHLESHSEDCTPVVSLAQDVEDLNIPEWLDDW